MFELKFIWFPLICDLVLWTALDQQLMNRCNTNSLNKMEAGYNSYSQNREVSSIHGGGPPSGGSGGGGCGGGGGHSSSGGGGGSGSQPPGGGGGGGGCGGGGGRGCGGSRGGQGGGSIGSSNDGGVSHYIELLIFKYQLHVMPFIMVMFITMPLTVRAP